MNVPFEKVPSLFMRCPVSSEAGFSPLGLWWEHHDLDQQWFPLCSPSAVASAHTTPEPSPGMTAPPLERPELVSGKVIISQIACGQADRTLLAASHCCQQEKLHSGLNSGWTQEEGLGNGYLIDHLGSNWEHSCQASY